MPVRAHGEDSTAAVARLDELWTRRAWPDSMGESVALGEHIVEGQPANFEVTWRLARGLWWSGHTADDQATMRRNCRAAMRQAEAAIALAPNRVEGHYYYALATGEYATTIGITHAAMEGVGHTVEQAAQRAYELDKQFDNGGPMVALGRFYAMLPWPLQDLEKSRRYLEEAKATHPTGLPGRFYLAETYYFMGQHDLARTELAFVLSVQPPDDVDPIRPPPRDQAAQRLAQWFPTFTPGP